MRTKSLLLAAALFSFAGASAMAQVYSVNAVGFVNVPLEAGKFKMIGNPLNTANNTLAGLLPNVPDDTTFYKYSPQGFDIATFGFGEWDKPTITMNPGEGGFIKSPTAYTITFVGEVMQSSAAPLNVNLTQGFQIVSSIVPQSLVLSAPAGTPSLDFPASDDDTIYLYRNVNGSYGYVIHQFGFGEWDKTPGPTPEVGEAFWVKKADTKTWTRTFTVN